MGRINLLVTILAVGVWYGCVNKGLAPTAIPQTATAQPCPTPDTTTDAQPAEISRVSVEGLDTARAVVELHTSAGQTSASELSEALRNALTTELRSLAVAVVPQSETLADIKKHISRPGVTPLIVTANVVSLKQKQQADNVSWEAVVTTSLADHPGGSLRVMLTEKAAVSRASRTYRPAIHAKAMQEKAVSEAARALSQGIVLSLSVI